MCHSKQPAKLTIPILTLLPLLLLLCYGVGSVHENRIDLQALLDFKQGITSDPNEALSNWTMSSHFCHWNGVTCTTARPWRVLALVLSNSGLGGQISSSLGNLTFMSYLDLSYNNFVGPLPLIGRLKQLEVLILNNNNLSGPIDDLADCSNLTYLELSSNSLVGSISPKFGLLSNLTIASFRINQLEGSIPGELGQLSNLEYLLLDDNRLSGEIPLSFFSLSSLKYLSLEYNMLGKALPPNIGELLPNLINITLENNSFEGPIPASLGDALGLEIIDFT
jgi:Leucine-rich repeat (LRR) protein